MYREMQISTGGLGTGGWHDVGVSCMRKRLRILELRADLGSGSRAGFEFAAMCVFGCEFGMVQRGGWITLGSGCVCVCACVFVGP